MTTLALSSSLQSYVRRYVARRRRLALFRAAGFAATFALAWMLAWCLVDRALHVPALIRAGALAAGAAAVGALLFKPAWALSRTEIDWIGAAREIEAKSERSNELLQTVTSQLLAPPQHRGSPELLEALVVEADRHVSGRNAAALVPRRRAAVPWIAAALVLASTLILLTVPWLNLRQLMRRFFEPFASIPSVTTTALSIEPGRDADVIEGQPFTVTVSTLRLGEQAPVFHFAAAGGAWSDEPMSPSATDTFTFTLSPVDRDVSYFVTGGDAETPRFVVRALRRPAVNSFRIRYTYPPYMHKAPQEITNTDGLIEAPVQSRATLTMIATDPLKDATLTIGSQKVPTEPTSDPTIRRANIPIDRDSPCRLELTSEQGVNGEGPRTMQIRALPDRPPLVQMIAPSEDLRLGPRDVVPIQYLASDDYGVISLGLRLRVNGALHRDIPIPLAGDARYQAGVARLDLAALGVKIGDVVVVSLVAGDGAGHVEATRPPRMILISPRSIDAAAHERIQALRDAERLSAALADELDAAAAGADAGKQATAISASPSAVDAAATVRGRLAAAEETAVSLRVLLLRVIARSDSAALSVTMARWADDVTRIVDRTDMEAARVGTPAADDLPSILARSARSAHTLHDHIATLAAGQLAAAVRAERVDLREMQRRLARTAQASTQSSAPATQPARLSNRREMATRVDKALRMSLADLKSNADAPDIDERLDALVKQADDLARAQAPVDFAAAAARWSADLPRSNRTQTPLQTRLSLAAQAEAIRPDASYMRASDLQLAGRVAAAIEAKMPPRPDSSMPAPRGPTTMPADADLATLLREFPAALAALQKEHELIGSGEAGRPLDEVKKIHADAAEARTKLERWVNNGASPAMATAEGKALEANAAAARRDYTQAASDDKALAQAIRNAARGAPTTGVSPSVKRLEPAGPRRPLEEWRSDVVRSMDAAARIEKIAAEQEKVRADTQASRGRADDLARRQTEIASAIAQVDRQERQAENDLMVEDHPATDQASAGRDGAMAAIQAAGDRLAAMPQQLARAQEAFAAQQRAAAAADAASEADSAASDAEARDAARRVSQRAAQDLSDARRSTDSAAGAITPDVADALSQKLSRFAPETAAAADAIDRQLAPLLRKLRQAIIAGDENAVAKSAAAARGAIDDVQSQLRSAEDAMVDRDPLSSARYFAAAAAEQLKSSAGGREKAIAQQTAAARALSKAWDRSIHNAGSARLWQLPPFLPVIAASSASATPDAFAPPIGAAGTSGARDWAFFAASHGEPLNASMRESDVAGYEDALRAYFEVLGRVHDSRK